MLSTFIGIKKEPIWLLFYFAFSFKKINLKSKRNGKPCNKTSNQSIGAIPLAPPMIHFNLPKIWGSGKNGAKPKVRHKMSTIFQLFIISMSESVIKFYCLIFSEWTSQKHLCRLPLFELDVL